MLESVFNKVAGLRFSWEYCEIFKKISFYKTPPVTASEISQISQENISGGGVIDLSFYNKND